MNVNTYVPLRVVNVVKAVYMPHALQNAHGSSSVVIHVLVLAQRIVLHVVKSVCTLVNMDHVVIHVTNLAVHAHMNVSGNVPITSVQRTVMIFVTDQDVIKNALSA